MARPSVPLISRRGAIEAALAIVNEEGLEALTLARLAKALGVRAPSLYHHFADKTDILTAAARSLLNDIPLPPERPPAEWQQWFMDISTSTYDHVMGHPHAAKLLLEHFPRTLVFPAHEIGSRLLIEAGVPMEAVATVVRGLERLEYGLILADAERKTVSTEAEDVAVPADRWPAFRAALDANRLDDRQVFQRNVQYYLAGVQACHLRPATPGLGSLLARLRARST